ncbi:MCE family protein [Mycobacterium sp. E2479]|uniref:MCE family protein n=1 Tax=Mycobacterium sp. E2479 TaxID=1834134 RepID=UPI0008006F4A|nr:MCE family protein [Mycobacterium sp. E2479]OBH49263.1 mammalian cell entry protein [Mycobacterium sp. E2479]
MKINRFALTHRRARGLLLAGLVALGCGGARLAWPEPAMITMTGYFSSAVGLYPGDDVMVAGVPVGSITAIRPQPTHTTITMTVRRAVAIPADARAVIMAPNLVAARFIEFAPVYQGGAKLATGTVIPSGRTAVPVEWDEVKDALTQLSARLGPRPGSVQGPVTNFVNQAANTFDGQGESFRQAVRELSETAGRLGDSRTDLVGTITNLHTLIDAVSHSNEQIVQFSNHVASVSQVLADSSSDLDTSLRTLNQALADVRGFLKDNNETLVSNINKLADFTTLLKTHSDDIQQVLHVAPNALANFYNMYDPAQGSLSGLLAFPQFANPVQFICGTLEASMLPEYQRRAEMCRERMAPVVRRLAFNYPPILFHAINSITAYKGQVVYDTPATQEKAQTPISQLQWLPVPGVTPPKIPGNADLGAMLVPPTTSGADAPRPSEPGR